MRGAPGVAALLAVGAMALSGCAASVEDGWQGPQYASSVGGPAPQEGWAPPQDPRAQPVFQEGRASYYSNRLAGHRTASGEPYEPTALTAAHRTLPLGSFIDVARPDGRHVVVRVNDRGPYGHGRILDLSRRAASQIGMIRDGVAEVAVRVLWVPQREQRR